MTSEEKLKKGVKTALADESFLVQKSDNDYNFGSVNTPYGTLSISIRNKSIFTVFTEYEKIPADIRIKMGVGMTGKWNFFGKDALKGFHGLFKQHITTAAILSGWFDGKPKLNYNYYNEKGEPLRILCYMYKGDPKPYKDYITVVYTHASRAGYPKGRILYRGMNGVPYDPAFGIAQMGEAQRGSFKPGGSKVGFFELPSDCREVVISDYNDLWNL